MLRLRKLEEEILVMLIQQLLDVSSHVTYLTVMLEDPRCPKEDKLQVWSFKRGKSIYLPSRMVSNPLGMGPETTTEYTTR